MVSLAKISKDNAETLLKEKENEKQVKELESQKREINNYVKTVGAEVENFLSSKNPVIPRLIAENHFDFIVDTSEFVIDQSLTNQLTKNDLVVYHYTDSPDDVYRSLILEKRKAFWFTMYSNIYNFIIIVLALALSLLFALPFLLLPMAVLDLSGDVTNPLIEKLLSWSFTFVESFDVKHIVGYLIGCIVINVIVLIMRDESPIDKEIKKAKQLEDQTLLK